MAEAAVRADAAYRLRFADWLQFPDDGRFYELLGGDLLVSPPPNTRHQRISRNLLVRIQRFLDAGSDQTAASGEVLAAPTGLRLSDQDVLEPDLMVILAEGPAQIRTQAVEGAPNLVIEILSPGTASRDLGPKRSAYERHGVSEYWIVDPEAETIEVLSLKDGQYINSDRAVHQGEIRSRALPGLAIPLDQIFPA